MDKTQLSAVFRAREGALRSCYERELKKNPSLGGKLTVKFTIGGAGRVTSASVTKHLDGSSAVGECVVSRIQTWKFPSPEGGDVTVSKSIVFSAGQ
jgi:TonB family protein